MGIIKTAAEREDLDILKHVTQKYRPDLVDAKVQISVYMCRHYDRHGDATGKPAVKLRGTPATAAIKVNSYDDRVEGKLDATIRIDQDRYEELTTRQRQAMFRHEIEHLVLVRNKKTNAVKRDDLSRPKLRCKPDDFAITGFDCVIAEFGDDALEKMSIQSLSRRYLQGTLYAEPADACGPNAEEEAASEPEAAAV